MCPMAMAVSHFWEVITGAQVLSSNLTQLKRQQKKGVALVAIRVFPSWNSDQKKM